MDYLYHLDYISGPLPQETPSAQRDPVERIFAPNWGITPEEKQKREGPGQNPIDHARMYAIAGFYEIPGLKTLAKEKFKEVATQHRGRKEFAEAIRMVFTTTAAEDKGLRDVVKEILLGNMSLLHNVDVEKVMREIPDLAFDMLKEFSEENRFEENIILSPKRKNQNKKKFTGNNW